jgi:hypothetical protein
MLSSYSAKQISKALFETDPMNTCCKENDCFDEYDRVAEAVAEMLAGGHSMSQALITEISEWFFDGEKFDTSRLEPVIEILGEVKQ